MKKQPLFESSGMKKILLKKIEEIKKEGKFKYYGLRFDAPFYKVGDVIKRNSKAGAREDMDIPGLCVYDINTNNKNLLDKIINTLYNTTTDIFFQGNTIYILGSDKRLSVDEVRKIMKKQEPEYFKKNPGMKHSQNSSKYLYDKFETRLLNPTVLAKINIQQPVENIGVRSELGFPIKQRSNFSDDLLRFKKEDSDQNNIDDYIEDDEYENDEYEDDFDPYELTEEERREKYGRFNKRNINPDEVIFDFRRYENLEKLESALIDFYREIKDGVYFYEDEYDEYGDKYDTSELADKLEKCVRAIKKYLSKGKQNEEKEKILIDQITKYLNMGDPNERALLYEIGVGAGLKPIGINSLFKGTKNDYRIKDPSNSLRKGEIEKYEIIKSIEEGNKKELLKLLKTGVDVNTKDEYGDTVLIQASGYGHTEIVKLLLKFGADVNAKNTNGDTALMRAFKMGHTEVVNLLLDAGADVNAKNEYGETALIYAARNGHTKTVKLLLEAGADVNAKNEGGETALMKASEKDHTEIVKMLLEAGADVNAKNTGGWTALIWASGYGHTEIVKLLLEAGADVNIKTKYGNTALIYAASKGYLDIVKTLIEFDTDVNIVGQDGLTSLKIASIKKEAEIVKLLLEAGAEIDPNDTKTMQFIVDHNLDYLVK